jgi:hypothetical protein
MSSNFFGTPIGIREGQCFSSRVAVKEAELHRFAVHGVDENGNEGASAVLISGAHKEDEDWGDYIIHTGHGGNAPRTKKQVEDQSWDSPGNKSLVLSEEKQLPVRVIRSFKHKSELSPASGYNYGGLYRVVDHWEEQSKSGFVICRYKFVKEEILEKDYEATIGNGSMVLLKSQDGTSKWFSIGVNAPNAQNISKTSKMAKLLFDKKVGESIEFGTGFEVLEIRKYMNK